MNRAKDEKKLIKIIISTLLFICCILPISKNGEALSNLVQGMYVIISFILIFLLYKKQKFNKKRFYIAIFLLIYLIIASFVTTNNSSYHFSLYRFATTATCFIILMMDINITFDFKFLNKLLTKMTTVVLLLNIIVYFNLFGSHEIVSSYYTQYLKYITDYQLTIHKPILTFGVHNVAAFFYMCLFIICYVIYEKYKIKKYLFYSICYIILLILTRCNTAIGMLLIATLFFVIRTKSKYKRLFICLCFILFFTVNAYSSLYTDIVDIVSRPSNGLISRYVENENYLYGNNFSFIKDHPLGMGFAVGNTSEDLYYADSGYFVNYFIGNILYLVIFYLLVYYFIKANIKSRINSFFIFFVIMSMELGFVTFHYYRTLIIILFLIYCMKTIETDNNENYKNNYKEKEVLINEKYIS